MYGYIYIRNDFCMHAFPITRHNGKLGTFGNGNKFETIEYWLEKGAAYSEEEAEENHERFRYNNEQQNPAHNEPIERILNKCLIEFTINGRENSFIVKNRGVYEAQRFVNFLREKAEEYEKQIEKVKRVAYVIEQINSDDNISFSNQPVPIKIMKNIRNRYQEEYGECVPPSLVMEAVELFVGNHVDDAYDTW